MSSGFGYGNTADALPPPSTKSTVRPPSMPRGSNPYSNTADAFAPTPASERTLVSGAPAQQRGSALTAFLKPDIIPNAVLIVRYAKKTSPFNCCCDVQPLRREAFNILVNGEIKTNKPGMSRVCQGGETKLEVPGKATFQLECHESDMCSTGVRQFGPFDPKVRRNITLKWVRDKGGKWAPDLFLEDD